MRTLAEQHEFNVRRWLEIVADPKLADVLERIETDRDGNLIMAPSPDDVHGGREGEIQRQLNRLLPDGVVYHNVTVSTAQGDKIPDVMWLSGKRWRSKDQLGTKEGIFIRAPEICVEIMSPSNSLEDMLAKKDLYLNCGAEEAWVCDQEAKMRFFSITGELAKSKLCPQFPVQILVGPQVVPEVGWHEKALENEIEH